MGGSAWAVARNSSGSDATSPHAVAGARCSLARPSTIMAKAKSTPAPTPAPTKGSKRSAAAAEIDDLFAAKKPKPAPAPAAADVEMVSPPTKKKDKGKGKAGPVEVVDTSATIERYRNAPAPLLAKKRKAGEDAEGDEKMQDEEEAFMDSRGTTSE